MNKGQGYRSLHECIAAAILNTIISDQLSTLSYQRYRKIEYNAFKRCQKKSPSTLTRTHNYVMQLLESFGCIYVPSMMFVADTVKILVLHYVMFTSTLKEIKLSLETIKRQLNAIVHIDADADANQYSCVWRSGPSCSKHR